MLDIQFDINGSLVVIDDLTAHLNNPLQARALKQMALKIDQDHHATICDNHQEPPVVAIIIRDEKIGARVSACCQHFMEQMHTALKPALAEAAAVSSGFGTVGTLDSQTDLTGKVLQLMLPRHSTQSFEFEINRIDRLTLGRLDTETGKRPDIDLAAFGAQESGVSRFHASLIRENNALFLIDTGSPNGTWLNDQRLTPHQPYAIQDGDCIYLGQFKLFIALTTYSAMGRGT